MSSQNNPGVNGALPDQETTLLEQRKTILSGLRRVHLAGMLILLVVVGLACTAIVAARLSQKSAAQAQLASHTASNQLWKAALAQARASRFSSVAGRKAEAVRAVEVAASIEPNIDLRNEAAGVLSLVDVEPLTFHPVSKGVFGYEPSPDLTAYAVAFENGTIELRSFSDSSTLQRFSESTSPALGRVFTKDGRLFAARTLSGTLLCWDVRSGELQFTRSLNRDEWHGGSLAFSPDGSMLAVGEPGLRRTLLLDPKSGATLQELKTDRPGTLRFHPNGRWLFSTWGTGAQIMDIKEKRILTETEAPQFISSADLSPDGERAVFGYSNGEIGLWHSRAKILQKVSGHSAHVSGVYVHPSGNYFASRSWDGTTRVWDMNAAQELLAINSGYALGFNSSGNALAFERELTGVGKWQFSGTDVRKSFSTGWGRKGIFSAALTQDKKILVAAKDESLNFFDYHSGALIKHLPTQRRWAHGAYFCSSGGECELVVHLEDFIGFWRMDSSDPREPMTLQLRRKIPLRRTPEEAGSLELSASGKRGVVPLYSNFLGVYDMEAGQQIKGIIVPGSIWRYCISPDDSTVAGTIRGLNEILLWDIATTNLTRLKDIPAGRLQYSPDGKWLASCSTADVVLIDLATRQVARRFPRALASGQAGPVAFSPDGELFAFVGDEHAVNIVSPSTGAAVLKLPSEIGCDTLQFSGNEHLVLATAYDQTIVWDLNALNRQLARFHLGWSSRTAPVARGGVATPSPNTYAGLFSSNNFMSLVLLVAFGVALALTAAVVVFVRQRRFLHSFEEVESLYLAQSRELQAAQRELMHSQKMKALGTLAAGIAHDFNNLLSVIRMSSELAEEARTPEAIREHTSEIERAVLQGKSVVRSMLGYSRSESATEAACAPKESVEALLRMLSREFLSGIEVVLDFPRGETPLVQGSRHRLEQIVLNILLNAAEAMQGKGRIKIRLEKLDELLGNEFFLRPRNAAEYVMLTVQDNGPGIDPEILPRIFEPFFTTKQNATSPGTGLGLSNVYNLAEAEGYGLCVESVLNQGTTMMVILPVAKLNSTSSTKEDAANPSPQGETVR